MAEQYQLYVDSDGIERGYYVYLHRERDTQEVFYVGKGHSQRAWQETGRNDLWKQRIQTLGVGWDVEIVADDLGEIEAFDMEALLVEQHGGCASEGGKLTNWVPGGESPLNVEITLDLGMDKGYQVWCDAYYEAREFKELSPKKQEEVATGIHDTLAAIYEPLDDLIDQAEENGDESLDECATELRCLLDTPYTIAREFLMHRRVWKEIGMSLEETCDDLEPDDIACLHKAVKPFAKAIADNAKHYLAQIDTGNRAAAERIADKAKEETP